MARHVLAPFLLWAATGSVVYAATIDEVISPAALVLASQNTREVATLDGTPVLYCGLAAFRAWASRLVGQTIASTPAQGITVPVDNRQVSLAGLMIRSGWLQPAQLDDEAQAAMTEGRGGWACAKAEVPFVLMHTSVDPKVLAGIALNESAWHGRAWPWTLNVAGQGYFFRSRTDAYGAMRALIAAGRCDFDVGIMQVNWCYHRQRFASPWDALAPAINIRVAESILNENYGRTHSVAKAIAYYHSANPAPGSAYLARFAHHLNQINAGL
ncbi:transglycosylase SLT domain-containing protein [Paraburkholderia kururiensis]|uniref:transglycosylase SLT domain-containing protein n=1 Tax=Paraburkholderia kururiensis TaxID=984307 RepID=UPI0005A9A985|nr:transglycosylase SLT domain-containing protein [Paraburkholderia kururiensis]